MSRHWLYLFSAFCVSSVGDRITVVVLFAVLHARGGAIEGLTLIALAQTVPAVLLGGLAGRLAGYGGQRNLLVALDGARCLILIGMAAAKDINILYILAAIQAGATTIYRPAEAVFEIQLIDPAHATKINAYRVLARQIVSVGGPAAAALLLTVFNPASLLLIDALSYAISAGLTLAISARGEPYAEETPEAIGWARSSLRLIRVQGLIMMFTLIFLLNLVLGMQGPLFFARLTALFDDGARNFGFMMSAMAAGSVATSLAISKFRGFESSRWSFLCAAVFLDGVALFLFTVSTSLSPILVLAVAMGLISAVYTIAIRTRLQTWPVASSRGRLLGLFEMVSGSAQVLSLIVAALAVTWVSELRILQAGALAELLVALVAWIVARPQVSDHAGDPNH